MSNNIIHEVRAMMQEQISISPDRATAYFKTGVGHYAESDVFIGVRVPNVRKIAKSFSDLVLDDIQSLIESRINEERLLALIILTHQYKSANPHDKEELYKFYLKNLQHVNNWNLVDSSAHLIIGAHLWNKDRSSLLTLAKSEVLWERRISIVSTWYFIRKNDIEWTFKIARIMLNDAHDLIHKAVGWMLREAGEKNSNELTKFLDQNAAVMPRTMLRYSIEKFPEEQRKNYLLQKR